MKSLPIPFNPLSAVALGLLAGVSLASLLTARPAIAQLSSDESQPLKDFQVQNRDAGSDPFSGRSSSGSSVFDIIHQATLNNNMSSEDFRAEQQESLNDAAALFKAQQAKQLEQLRQRNSVAPTMPAPTPSVGN